MAPQFIDMAQSINIAKCRGTIQNISGLAFINYIMRVFKKSELETHKAKFAELWV